MQRRDLGCYHINAKYNSAKADTVEYLQADEPFIL